MDYLSSIPAKQKYNPSSQVIPYSFAFNVSNRFLARMESHRKVRCQPYRKFIPLLYGFTRLNKVKKSLGTMVYVEKF
jgi:hypothetical protein